MSDSYKKLFHRWEVLRGGLPGILFALVCIGLQLFFLGYMSALGLVDEQVAIPIGPITLPISMPLMLALGNVVVLVVLWMTVFETSAFVKTGPDRQVKRILYPLRMVRMAALVLTPFTLILFLPYVLQSTWFLNFASSTQILQGAGTSIYNWSLGAQKLDFSTRFIISELAATLAALVVSGLQIWRVRGTRNLSLMLRKKR